MPEANEQFVNITFPLRGLDVTGEFAGQMPLTTTDCVNVRTFEATTRRGRGGIRPGINRYIDQRVGGLDSPIQHLNYIVDPQAIALVAPDETIGVDYIEDPSTNNLRTRNPNNGSPRMVRRKGNARQTNRNVPATGKRTPNVAWGAISDIWLGTALGGTQLNATATDPVTLLPVAGTFTYVPAAGTVLAIGQQSIDCTFNPTNTAVYNSFGPFSQGIIVNGISRRQTTAAVFASDVVVGNIVLVCVQTVHSSSGVTVSVSDSRGSSYTQIGSYVSDDLAGSYLVISMWYANLASSGPNTVTVTPTAGVATKSCAEFAGVVAINDVISETATSGGGTTVGVSLDREVIVVFPAGAAITATVALPGFAIWTSGSAYDNAAANGEHDQASLIDPRGGTNSSKTVFTGTGAAPWAGMAISMQHRVN